MWIDAAKETLQLLMTKKLELKESCFVAAAELSSYYAHSCYPKKKKTKKCIQEGRKEGRRLQSEYHRKEGGDEGDLRNFVCLFCFFTNAFCEVRASEHVVIGSKSLEPSFYSFPQVLLICSSCGLADEAQAF